MHLKMLSVKWRPSCPGGGGGGGVGGWGGGVGGWGGGVGGGWVNKGIGFLFELKFFALNIFCEEYLQPSLCYRAANLQNTFSVFCWKNFRIFNNFSVSLILFLSRLKTVTSYLLWWDPLAPSGNSSGFFRYCRNRKWGRARVTTTCGREKNECFGD